jgi:hypothetical protein
MLVGARPPHTQGARLRGVRTGAKAQTRAPHAPAAARTCGLGNALHVLVRHAPRAEDAAVGKVLRAQVANRQPARV